MSTFRRNGSKPTAPTPETELKYEEVKDEVKEVNEVKKGFHFNKKEEKTENKISVQTEVNKTSEWDSTNKILPKFVNKSQRATFGSAVEFSKSAFSLTKRNEEGYRESLDGKMLMNFWTFDQKTNKQLTFVPAYVDMSEWLNVCHMILSGRLHDMTDEARAKQKSGGFKYCGFVYQSIGGSYKPIFKIDGKPFGGDADHPIATLFKITPAGDASVSDKWTLSAEIMQGATGPTGLIEPVKNGKALAKVTVLMTYDDLVRVARMSEMAILVHMMRI